MNDAAIIRPATAIENRAFDAELIEDFIKWIDRSEATARAYIINLRQFAAYLKYKGIDRPSRSDVVSFRAWLSEEHEAIEMTAAGEIVAQLDSNGDPIKRTCKPATVKAYLQSLKQFFKWAATSGFYPDIAANVHAPKVNNAQHKKDHLTPAQVLTVEQSITHKAQEAQEAAENARKDPTGRAQRATEQGKRLFAMYLLAVNCGLRTVEISRANIRDLQTKDGNAVLYIWGKGHSEADQKKALAPAVYDAVKDYLTVRSGSTAANAPLFTSTGNRSHGRRIAPTTVSKMLKSALVNAGYNSERLTAHSLRHSAGTAVQSITGDLYETQKYMRHANPATTEIYIHESDAEDSKAAELAQSLYNLYHGTEAAEQRAKLTDTITMMTPEQLAQLARLAANII